MARQYKAFISYSWSDKKWANWLHHALETYHTPKELVGQPAANGGEVPARLHPIFKDREEEAAGHGITAAIEAGMGASEFLIVVCSPRSAKSEWVNKEIAWFKANRDPHKILAVVVDGEPGASFMPGREEEECFPTALLFKCEDKLELAAEREDSPLAADARYESDGKNGAKLKVAAAMLGVGLDDLVKRDERRQARRTRMIVTASLALAVVMSVLAVVAITSRNAAVAARTEAEFQRGEADGLIEFMLTDLRKRLDAVGRLDALDAVGARALKYYAGQKPSYLDATALGRRSRALHLVGEVRNLRGDSEAALAAFRQAATATKELLARNPDNAERIFDHAQSVFWVGYIAYERGQSKEAEAQFRDYKRLAERLIKLDPKKPEWQMEQSYAETNLGVLLYDEGRYAEAEPAFARALRIVEAVAAKEPRDNAQQLEIGATAHWLAKARVELFRWAEALDVYHREIALYDVVLRLDPGNSNARRLQGISWNGVGSIHAQQGQNNEALDAFDKSLAIFKQLRVIEPTNTEWQESEIGSLNWRADILFYQDRHSQSREAHAAAVRSLNGLIANDPKNAIWSVEWRSRLDVQHARMDYAGGKLQSALQKTNVAILRLRKTGNPNASEVKAILSNSELLRGDILAKLGRASEARLAWQAALDAVDQSESAQRSGTMNNRFVALKRLGRKADALAASVELDRRGFRHPAYLKERSR
jgi:tetratricopeptide (TPR) repeat protein